MLDVCLDVWRRRYFPSLSCLVSLTEAAASKPGNSTVVKEDKGITLIPFNPSVHFVTPFKGSEHEVSLTRLLNNRGTRQRNGSMGRVAGHRSFTHRFNASFVLRSCCRVIFLMHISTARISTCT
ncbi:hypothetical protein HDV57DRAFT_485764 [Trichoderma longibrachiatum]|uniref:Uncharacterized protein n=1 Tax=Trichoderma longibrachiatum ATCC 18648 TaxID=983965 RepID=A0A2T4CC76_TRILO|nr:hypothetical protein M440DRAFT_1162158 [Trichoderma longibrachiatum ATCC 18648]